MDSKIFLARIEDTLTICNRSEKPKFLGFVSNEEAVLADKFLQNKNSKYRMFGGFDMAQRVVIGCFPDWMDDAHFPITALTFTFRKNDTLHHRDFLGALMSLGIARETVGDILVENGRAVVFVLDDIKDFILNNVSKIGRTGVTVSEGFSSPLPETDKLVEKTDTIASARLDCIVSSLALVSRNIANELISNGFVSVNSVVCQKSTKTACEGDIITVRGKGKFIISSLSGRTKKDRIILEFKKYS